MIDYTELVTAIANNLEISTTDSERISRLNIAANLNMVQLELLNSLPVRYLTSAVKTVKFNIQTGIPDYQWPADFIRYVQLWTDYNNPITYSNPGREALEYRWEEHSRSIESLSSQLFPLIEMNVEAGFQISPVPDANVTHGFRLKYVYHLPTISCDQPSLLYSRFKGLLVDGTTSRSAATDNFRPDLAKFHNDLYTRAVAAFLPKIDKNSLTT